MRIYLSILLCISFISLRAGDLNESELETMRQQEDTLQRSLDALRKAPNDEERKKCNADFLALMREPTKMKGAFEYPFDSLKSIARIYAPDKYFRIFNWNIENDNGTFMYYGFVLVPGNKTPVFELTDQSAMIRKDVEKEVLTDKKWFGALYYDIILSDNSGGRKEYTLLGWDGNNRTSGKKLLDVMIISGDKIQFGAPIFKNGKEVLRRVIFEHSSQASMSLRYHEKEQRIIFDHLSPESPAAEGVREYYFPDGSYDAYQLENGKWTFVPDVDARRTKDRRDKGFNNPGGN